MKRLTPEQFYEQNRERFLYQIPAKPQSVCIQEMMQAYADHIEETAWVVDGSLPPVDEWPDSIDVNTCFDDGSIHTNHYKYSIKEWKYRGVVAWRSLPTLPKNL